MKIPSDCPLDIYNKYAEEFWKAAYKYGSEYGVIIQVMQQQNITVQPPKAEEIFFMIGKNKFSSIKDLRKALRLQAFM